MAPAARNEMKLVELNINRAPDERIVRKGEERRCTKLSGLLLSVGVVVGIIHVSANLRWHPTRPRSSRGGSEEAGVN